MINIKPSLMDMTTSYSVRGPSVTEFKDFSIYTSCMLKYEKYSRSILKLNSIHTSAKITLFANRKLLSPILKMQNELVKLPDIQLVNVDSMVAKIINPKVNDIPKCLSSELLNISIREGSNGTSDILDPNDVSLIGINDNTNEAEDIILEKLNNYKKDLSKDKEDIIKSINKIMMGIIDEDILKLFYSLDLFQGFIDNSRFLYLYRDWKDLYSCLSDNCPELSRFMPDDSFLWYDEDKTEFIIPVDINSGKLRIHKFFENLSKEEKIQANLIEKRYYKYVEDKYKILQKASEKVKTLGIKEEYNPFEELIKEKEENQEVINTLF